MRASARGDDRGKENGNRKRKGEDSKGVNEERADRWSALNIWYVVDKERILIKQPSMAETAFISMFYFAERNSQKLVRVCTSVLPTRIPTALSTLSFFVCKIIRRRADRRSANGSRPLHNSLHMASRKPLSFSCERGNFSPRARRG